MTRSPQPPIRCSRIGPTPDGVPPFDRIKPEHFRPAYARALAEHEAEIAAIAADAAPPSFDNTIAALELSGRALERVENVFHILAGAHSNDALLESSARSRRRSRGIGTRSIPMRHCFGASMTVMREADTLGLDCRAKARDSSATTQLPPRRRRRSTPRRKRASPRSSNGLRRWAPRSARTCSPTSRPSRLRSKARPNLPACPISCARRCKSEAHERGPRRLCGHAVAFQRRAVPAILRAARSARESLSRLRHARRQRRGDRQQGDHRRDSAAARRAGAAARLMPTSPITGSTTRWRRRRRRCAIFSIRSGRGRARARSPTATPCRRWSRRRAAISSLRRGTGAITPRSCGNGAAISTRPRSSPTSISIA